MGYTPEYWEKNKAEANARRSELYKNDPDYRAAARERSKKYRDRKRAEREAQKPKPTITIGLTEHEAMTTTQVCEYVGCNATRIKYMQRVGYLPPAVVTRPVRLYSKNQAKLIKSLDQFLQKNKNALRGPATTRSKAVLKKLNEKISTIKQNWNS